MICCYRVSVDGVRGTSFLILMDHKPLRVGNRGGRRRLGRATVRVPVNPIHIGLLGLVVAAIFVVWGYVGFRAFHSSLYRAVDREGRALLESLVQSAEVAARANQFIRLQQIQALSDKASLVAAEAAARNINFDSAGRFLSENDLDGIAVLEPSGKMSAYPAQVMSVFNPADSELVDALDNLRRGLTSWETIVRTDSATGEEWIGALVRGKPRGNIYSALTQVTRLEELFRDIGIGRLIQLVGQEAGINYILLQTPEGILFSSRDLKPVLRIASDSFLVAVIAENKTATRELAFEGQEVLEAARPFVSEHISSGVFRVGLNLNSAHQAEDQLRRQLVFSSLFLGLLTIAVLGFIIVRQHLAVVSRSYAQISTMTGRILDSIDGAVVAINADGRITHFNPTAERLFGRRTPEVIDAPITQLFSADEAGLALVSQSGQTIHERNWVRTADGRQQFLTVSTSPIRQPDGSSGGAVAVIVDQTESRKLTERMRRAERLSELGTLAAGVAHEVRNPLNAIGLAAQRLALEFEVKKDSEEFHQFTGAIISETRRLDKIIGDFLDLARAPREAPAKFVLAEVVNEVTALLGLEAGEKGVRLTVTGQPGIELFGVPAELKKAIINVLSNAIAATPSGGKIDVSQSAIPDERLVVIRVTDTGVGIPAEHRDKIFQPYFSTKPQGTGLGLAITARVVADFGGTIEVESQSGQGTTVEMRLPLAG